MLSAPATPVTVIASLHQPELARQHCTRAIGLRAGRLIFDVPTHRLDDSILDDLYTPA